VLQEQYKRNAVVSEDVVEEIEEAAGISIIHQKKKLPLPMDLVKLLLLGSVSIKLKKSKNLFLSLSGKFR
jgi:hypothetical protein